MEEGNLLELIMKYIVEEREGGKLIELSSTELKRDSNSLIAIYGLAEGYRRERVWALAFGAFQTLYELQEQSGNFLINQETVKKLMDRCLEESMMELHLLLLKCVVNRIKSETTKLIECKINETFEVFGEECRVGFLDYIEKKHADSPRECAMCFSTLFFSTGYNRALDRIENLVMQGCFDYDISRGLVINIEVQRFHRGIDFPKYSWERALMDVLIDKFNKTFIMETRHKHVSERVSNRVVVTTWQMLSMLHAPSRMVYRLCKCLQEVLNYEVLLVICAESVGTIEACKEIWGETWKVNMDEKLWGLNKVQYVKGESYITTLQIPICSEQSGAVTEAIKFIIDFNPMYVWNVNETCCLAEYLGEITTLVSMPCHAGLSASNAEILIRYMKLNDGNEQEEFAEKQRQTILDINWVEEKPDLASIDREDFAIQGPNSFLIGIMGNRLNTELTESFMDLMKRVIDLNPQVVYVIIGNCDLDFAAKGLENNVILLGFRQDYMSVFKSLDLVMNPKRSGAGSNALAVMVGTPVITLPNCDVASAIGSDAFICDDYSEYITLIGRYINDPEFMKSQVEECNRLEKERYRVTVEDEIQRIDRLIRENIVS